LTEIPTREFAAVAPSSEAATAASSGAPRRLLDAAVARVITALAHDLRNSLGVVSMQVEAIAVRAIAPISDIERIHGHAGVASDHIERLAGMMNALIAFARGRTSSDLAVIVAEAAALVPLRPVTVSSPSVAAVGLDPLLVRAVALEVLVLALESNSPPGFVVSSDSAGSTISLNSGGPLLVNATLEWVVQFRSAGGRIQPTEDGLRLQFPPIA
jgi:signal transduction histidine kinase